MGFCEIAICEIGFFEITIREIKIRPKISNFTNLELIYNLRGALVFYPFFTPVPTTALSQFSNTLQTYLEYYFANGYFEESYFANGYFEESYFANVYFAQLYFAIGYFVYSRDPNLST